MSTQEEQYRAWASACTHLPIFFQPWWLDAVCPGQWAVALAKDEGGKITAVLPFHHTQKWFLPGIDMPILTPYLGPWYDFPVGIKKATRYALEHAALEQMLAQLPRHVFFRQRWHPQLSNALALRWQGFRLDIKYTYCLDLGKGELEKDFTAALRNNIRNAEKQYRVEKSQSAEGFYALNRQSFAAQQIQMPYSEVQFLQLDQQALLHESRSLYRAIHGASGAVEAAIYMVYDQQYAYLLATGRLPSAHSGAVALLIGQAMQDLAAAGIQVFDFEGSSLRGVEGFFRQFGGTLKMGLVVKRMLGR
ncbi:GNAT family N-acetyltransferase [Haliscomenobacter hydrossis]|uniref:BioF2-like acetyltransferase domain-containing protein n=1 Tax=Haliscomenobacter hydrossis (strain ATCC 27775 / DSM 1100 / LMG 10767 / O) TaxID=760192 RepID=F4KT27_HALH1|nr:GNAT family N-acetyltransferase [Haliscomenobacter hydrossis]AEE50097.1 hypothetical protein Halhy_2215 [Haliscomenobacter hydrossis DSM 1100]